MQRMIDPSVSVILPNYNHARFLDQRLRTILDQTYKNFEVIILDDQSSDNSIDIIKRYQDNKHISHVIINKENSGSPFKQWKKGFNLAKGDLIWIAESDDFCEPTLIETLVAEFQKDKNCVLAFCKSIKIDISGKPIGEVQMKKDFHMDGLSFLNHYLYRFCYISNASSAIFKKSVINQVDESYTSFKGSGDWVFWIEISRCGNIAYVNQPLNYFRIHGLNTTTQQLFTGKNESEAIEVYRFMREKQYINYFMELRERIAHIYSIKYGKLKKVLSNEKKKELLEGWKSNSFINIITTIVYAMQRYFGIIIIKR